MTAIDLAAVDAFAARAHGSINQRRKYTGTPYIEHPRAAARLVRAVGLPDLAIAVALLHDVVEDTPVTADEIRARFGDEVADRVLLLTDEPATPGRNRATRKAATIERLRGADRLVQSVKLADLIDNTSSIVLHDPDFAQVYLPEKEALLAVLTLGEQRLQWYAQRMLAGAKRRLERLQALPSHEVRCSA